MFGKLVIHLGLGKSFLLSSLFVFACINIFLTLSRMSFFLLTTSLGLRA